MMNGHRPENIGPQGRRRYIYIYIYIYIQGAAEITPTFRKITVGSPKQIVGCGSFR
jgi:hypothetical protein